MTRCGLPGGPTLAISALLIGGLAGWLPGPLPAANPGLFAASAPHRLPRMIVPGAFSPEQDKTCDPAAESMMIEGQWVTCYAELESAAARPRDASLAAMAVSRP